MEAKHMTKAETDALKDIVSDELAVCLGRVADRITASNKLPADKLDYMVAPVISIAINSLAQVQGSLIGKHVHPEELATTVSALADQARKAYQEGTTKGLVYACKELINSGKIQRGLNLVKTIMDEATDERAEVLKEMASKQADDFMREVMKTTKKT